MFSLSGIGKANGMAVLLALSLVEILVFALAAKPARRRSEKQESDLGRALPSPATLAVPRIAVTEDVVRRPKEHEVRIDFALRHLRGVMAAIIFTAHPCAHASCCKATNQGTRSHRPLVLLEARIG